MRMSGFLSIRHRMCVWKKFKSVVPLTAVSIVFISLLLAGCKKRSAPEVPPSVSARPAESAITNRMQDAAYRKALDLNRREQGKKASERNKIVEKMEQMIAKARASLPAGADDAAVKAELAKNPEWVELEKQNAHATAEIDKTLAEAREKIRQRMLAEARDVKAVSEGKATASDPAAAK